jgi:hypothetical protein
VDSLLKRHCPSYGGGHVNVNVKPVKGVVAAYLAKYMSKGKQMIIEALEDWGEDNCPRTWWNMTKACRDMVKAATHKGRVAGRLLEQVMELAWDSGGDLGIVFLRSIELEYDGVKHVVGWRGRFDDDNSRIIRGMLGCLDIQTS